MASSVFCRVWYDSEARVFTAIPSIQDFTGSPGLKFIRATLDRLELYSALRQCIDSILIATQ